MGKLYDTDIIAWSLEQAALLRRGRWAELDLDNIAEEIEEVGKSDQREFSSRFTVLVTHLLKWRFQPHLRSKSWQTTIRVQRSKIARRLQKTPSLRHDMGRTDWLHDIWADAVDDAEEQTGLEDVFPHEPMWTAEQLLDPNFLPD